LIDLEEWSPPERRSEVSQVRAGTAGVEVAFMSGRMGSGWSGRKDANSFLPHLPADAGGSG
jgi:hypothetical protein